MMPLVNVEGLKRKNQNPKTGSIPDLSLELGTASIVVQIINISSALHLGKLVRHVVKRTILPRSAGLEKAKALVELSTNHLNTEK